MSRGYSNRTIYFIAIKIMKPYNRQITVYNCAVLNLKV